MRRAPEKDLYSILGVTPDATAEEIRDSYLARTRVIHPDRFDRQLQSQDWKKANEMLAELNEAYSILRNSSTRAQYNDLPAGKRQQQSPPPPSTNQQSKSSTLGWIIGVVVILILSTMIGVTLYQSHLKRVATSIMENMVSIPSGSFLMGSPSSEKGRDSDEVQHRVTISKGFWMGKYEVTQEQWQSIMGSNPSHCKGDNRPVENVSWNSVQIFIRKLNRQTGKRFRLPTEAEWEYACRGGTDTTYCFGDGAGQLLQYAWYVENSGDQTHPVGQKKPNAWGLYDMHGNVCEWCQDWYGKYPSGSVTDPTGPSSGFVRVLRGGSGANYARGCRSENRSWGYPSSWVNSLGFRLARDE